MLPVCHSVSRWDTIKNDDTVSKIGGHNKIVLHNKSGLLGVKYKSTIDIHRLRGSAKPSRVLKLLY